MSANLRSLAWFVAGILVGAGFCLFLSIPNSLNWSEIGIVLFGTFSAYYTFLFGDLFADAQRRRLNQIRLAWAIWRSK
jgi:hypothetical protein